MTDSDRKRGVLSQADRDWLQNPDEYSRQAGYQRKRKVRQRLHNAILDFGLVTELDPERRREIFELEDVAAEGDGDKTDMRIGLEVMLTFIHQLVVDDGADVEKIPGVPGHKSRSFERSLRNALEHAYLEHDLVLEQLHLEVESREVPGVADVKDRVSRGAPVDAHTVRHLIDTDEISSEAYYEFLAEELEVDPPRPRRDK